MDNNKYFKLAFKILDDYYKKVRNRYVYHEIIASTTFHSFDIANALYSISDESYKYVIDNIKLSNYHTLINIFSGSGRLIRDLDDLHLVDSFNAIYNVDSSIEMINFEKTKLGDIDKIRYICTDFLNMDICPSDKNLIICHCGIRYLEKKQLYLFIQRIKRLLSGDSVCYITETTKSIIDLLINGIIKLNLVYELQEENIIMHRNTKMYVAFWLYNSNEYFQSIINEISYRYNKIYYEILKEVAGYKTAKLFILKVSQKS